MADKLTRIHTVETIKKKKKKITKLDFWKADLNLLGICLVGSNGIAQEGKDVQESQLIISDNFSKTQEKSEVQEV